MPPRDTIQKELLSETCVGTSGSSVGGNAIEKKDFTPSEAPR